MRKIIYEGIDFEAKLISRKVPVCRRGEAVFITKEKVFLKEIKYKNFEILKQGKAVVLKIIFQESIVINKLEALNLLDILKNLLNEFEVDIREIKEKY